MTGDEWVLPLQVELRGGALEEYHNFIRFLGHTVVVTLTEGPPAILWSLASSDLISGWKRLNCQDLCKPLGQVVFHSFLWHVWLERNDVIFRDVKASGFWVFFCCLLASVSRLKVHAVISQHDFKIWMR
ncbi:hypothetical protein LINPERPRIM_LOCUS41261 [Linum perenne]